MGRPTGSKANRSLTLLFGECVTRPTGHSRDVIPRCGPLSIFSALAQCCPTAVRIDDAGPRDGISELEANKLLEKNGFRRVRDRRAVARSKIEDPMGAGLYLFCERKWRDPSEPTDLACMMETWKQMQLMHPVFARECPFDMLLDVVRTCDEDWKPKGTNWKRRRSRRGEKFSQVLTKNLDDEERDAKRQRLEAESPELDDASDDESDETASENDEPKPPYKKPAFADALMLAASSLSKDAADQVSSVAPGVPVAVSADTLNAAIDQNVHKKGSGLLAESASRPHTTSSNQSTGRKSPSANPTGGGARAQNQKPNPSQNQTHSRPQDSEQNRTVLVKNESDCPPMGSDAGRESNGESSPRDHEVNLLKLLQHAAAQQGAQNAETAPNLKPGTQSGSGADNKVASSGEFTVAGGDLAASLGVGPGAGAMGPVAMGLPSGPRLGGWEGMASLQAQQQLGQAKLQAQQQLGQGNLNLNQLAALQAQAASGFSGCGPPGAMAPGVNLASLSAAALAGNPGLAALLSAPANLKSPLNPLVALPPGAGGLGMFNPLLMPGSTAGAVLQPHIFFLCPQMMMPMDPGALPQLVNPQHIISANHPQVVRPVSRYGLAAGQ